MIVRLIQKTVEGQQCGPANDPLCVLPTPINGHIPGWVQVPNVRGTSDILWTCLATTFLCTYTLLCLNVPSPRDTTFQLGLRRVKWMLLAILAPEIVLTYAAGQWSRARQSVDAFHLSGYEQWNMRMAFFADMGGFMLHTSDCEPFPLNAKQLHWLIVNGHLEYPKVTQEEIWDKSKQDRLAKAITVFQITYFVVHCIGRTAQGLPLTTLELSTLAIVVCSLMTAFAWLRKPSDVSTPVHLTCLSSTFQMAGVRTWRQTPLDFIDSNLPGWSLNVQPFMGLPTIPGARPLQCIPNDRFPTNPYGAQEYLLCLATLVFTAIHVAGWNFAFPSPAERLLWRVSSVALFSVTALFWMLETVASWCRLGRWHKIFLRLFKCSALTRFEQAWLKSKEIGAEPQERDPADLPQPWEFWTITPVAVLYGLARLYLIAETFLEMRNLPSTAFLT
jgi:hypothetical protein